jgi:integrase
MPFRPAVLKTLQSRTVVEYWIHNPATGKLVRKHIRVDNVSVSERKRYGKHLVDEINKKLYAGWNPWLNEESALGFRLLVDLIKEYMSERAREDLRKDSLRSMKSISNILIGWLQLSKYDAILLNLFDQEKANAFMEWLWNERQLSSVTYNNYLDFYKSLWKYFITKRYATANPFESVAKKREKKEKTRTIIPDHDRELIREYWMEHNPYYLVPCMLAYGCQIRRLEACKLRVGDLCIETNTILVPCETSKNGNTRVITMPNFVVEYLLELGITKYPDHYHLVSEGFRPGKARLPEKHISDAWVKMRKALNMPATYQFYSLRDTGITQMLVDGIPAHQVRDQADHYSLTQTDTYTRHGRNKANPLIINKTTGF